MDRAILGDQHGQENLVNFFVLKVNISLPHRGGVIELCFLKLSLCTCGTNAAALIVSAGK